MNIRSAQFLWRYIAMDQSLGQQNGLTGCLSDRAEKATGSNRTCGAASWEEACCNRSDGSFWPTWVLGSQWGYNVVLKVHLYYSFSQLLRHISWNLPSSSQNCKHKTQFSNYIYRTHLCSKSNIFRSYTQRVKIKTLLSNHLTLHQKTYF